MDVVEWLLDADPAIRWQVMRDLLDDVPADAVAAERARVATEGWGARLLALQDQRGQWGGGTYFPLWTSTAWTLMLARDLGLDPGSPEAGHAIARVRANSRWDHDGEPFFAGEVEPCINGMAVAIGGYFGEDVRPIVDRLLSEQMEDGGWNCEQENGSVRGSVHTTIDVLEGLLEYERAVGSAPDVTAARLRGQEYLLERRMLRRLSTGDIIDPTWTRHDSRTLPGTSTTCCAVSTTCDGPMSSRTSGWPRPSGLSRRNAMGRAAGLLRARTRAPSTSTWTRGRVDPAAGTRCARCVSSDGMTRLTKPRDLGSSGAGCGRANSSRASGISDAHAAMPPEMCANDRGGRHSVPARGPRAHHPSALRWSFD